MSPEASAVWMWVAINTSFLAILFLILWRNEKRFSNRMEKLSWEMEDCFNDSTKANEELIQLCQELKDANFRLLAIIKSELQEDTDEGEGWKNGR